MSGFIVGADRNQATLFPERLDDFVAEESATRVDEELADQVWEAWDKGEIDDAIARIVRMLIAMLGK